MLSTIRINKGEDMEMWLEEVMEIAETYGWNKDRAMVFILDIRVCYDKGMTPEKCVEVVF